MMDDDDAEPLWLKEIKREDEDNSKLALNKTLCCKVLDIKNPKIFVKSWKLLEYILSYQGLVLNVVNITQVLLKLFLEILEY